MSGNIRANVKRTLQYLGRNGIKDTCYAVRERLEEKKAPPYCRRIPLAEELERQRKACEESGPVCTFSIVVPCYRTDRDYLLKMIESVCGQTYPYWELILADATEDDSVQRPAETVKDDRIRYLRLKSNNGIAENTNQGIRAACGEYVGLLDHDDMLAEDALFWMAEAISKGREAGNVPQLLYSDEDKCSGGGAEFYEPHYKENFNLDLFLSNNYICHFMVMKRELIQCLLQRPEYDGAQDFDLALRAVSRLEGQEESIVHVPRILYHWRCHSSSTAENPRSKGYAYEAGRRAVQDYADGRGWRAVAENTKHLGFYCLRYSGDLFEARKDVGAIGGPLIRKGRICGGRMTEEGQVFYEHLNRRFSGYMHRASLAQDAEVLDLRNLQVREEARELFRETVGVPWRTLPQHEIFDVSVLPEGADITALSVALGRALRRAGYRLLYLPECERILKK